MIDNSPRRIFLHVQSTICLEKKFTRLEYNKRKKDRYLFTISIFVLSLVGMAFLYEFLSFFYKTSKSFNLGVAITHGIFSVTILMAQCVLVNLFKNPEILEGFNQLIWINAGITLTKSQQPSSHKKNIRRFEISPILVSAVVVPEPFILMVILFYFDIEPLGFLFKDIQAALGHDKVCLEVYYFLLSLRVVIMLSIFEGVRFVGFRLLWFIIVADSLRNTIEYLKYQIFKIFPNTKYVKRQYMLLMMSYHRIK